MAIRTEKLAAGVLHALSGRRNAVAPKNWDDAQWRGRIDARALRERYSDPRIHAELIALAGSNGQRFEQLEQARVEARVPQVWSGVRANLDKLRQRHPLPALSEHLAALVDDQRAFGLAALGLIGAAPAPPPMPVPKPTTTQSPTTHMDALRSARDVPRGTGRYKMFPRRHASRDRQGPSRLRRPLFERRRASRAPGQRRTRPRRRFASRRPAGPSARYRPGVGCARPEGSGKSRGSRRVANPPG